MSSLARMSAPIWRSGVTTRFMGRFWSELSPVIFVVNCWPLRMPERRRMVVPEFSASRVRQLLFSPRKPWPVIWTVVLVDSDVRAERFHAAERAVAIARRGEIAQFAGAFGKSSDHGVAMRNGFIAGRFDTTRERADSVDDLFFHDWILVSV